MQVTRAATSSARPELPGGDRQLAVTAGEPLRRCAVDDGVALQRTVMECLHLAHVV